MKKKVGILLICSSLLVGRSEGALESGQTSDFQSIVENEDAIGGYTPVHHYQKSKDATDKIKGIAEILSKVVSRVYKPILEN